MTVQEIMQAVREVEIKPDVDGWIIAITVSKDGKAEMAGNVTVPVLKALGQYLIEIAIKEDIKNAL